MVVVARKKRAVGPQDGAKVPVGGTQGPTNVNLHKRSEATACSISFRFFALMLEDLQVLGSLVASHHLEFSGAFKLVALGLPMDVHQSGSSGERILVQCTVCSM